MGSLRFTAMSPICVLEARGSGFDKTMRALACPLFAALKAPSKSFELFISSASICTASDRATTLSSRSWEALTAGSPRTATGESLGDDLLEYLQLLPAELREVEKHPRNVPARPRE